jgi:RNA polymerase sigma-70 factor, ECF subfamily
MRVELDSPMIDAQVTPHIVTQGGSKAVHVETVDRVEQGAVAMASDGNLARQDETGVVAAAKSGDRRAFELLVERHRRGILFLVLRITANREDAEDVVQLAFQKAFVHLQDFEGRSSFFTWLARIALNEALMLRRSDRKSREVSIDDAIENEGIDLVLEVADARPNPEHSYSHGERQRILFSAMNELAPGTRMALEICGLDERSLVETAQILGISVTAVKSRVQRGRKALRAKLKRYAMLN